MSELIVLNTPESLIKAQVALVDMLADGKPVRMKLTKTAKRSLSQNALYWKWCSELSEQIKQRTGQEHDAETVHEYFKLKFCPQKEVLFGKSNLKLQSTTRLDKGEFTFYLNQIEQWSVNLGFRLTIPEDSEYRELMRVQDE